MTNATPGPVEAELKPCPNPWCKTSKPALMQGGYKGRYYRVQCVTCGTNCDIETEFKAKAITAWNTRIEAVRPVSGEPVAWMYQAHTPDGPKTVLTRFKSTHYDGYPVTDETPLYAARPVQSNLVEAEAEVGLLEAVRDLLNARDRLGLAVMERRDLWEVLAKATGDGL